MSYFQDKESNSYKVTQNKLVCFVLLIYLNLLLAKILTNGYRGSDLV